MDNNILGKISSIGQTATQAGSAIASLTNGVDAEDIRGRFLNGFFGEGTLFSPSVFSRLFDEPTYLTFRIEFNFKNDLNKVPSTGNSVSTMLNAQFDHSQYDNFPEPLLQLNRTSEDPASFYRNKSFRTAAPLEYSTYDYLRNALGEVRRADMLYLFINGLKDIQENYPYYFQKVTGLGNLMKVNPGDGIRLKDGENTISIECLEGLDLKITQLMQLYKNVAWDEFYQRWILTDMMRFFNMKIYVSEIRLFHSAGVRGNPYKGKMYDFDGDSGALNANSYDKLKGVGSLLNSINDVLNTASAISSRLFGTNSTVTKVTNTINQTVDTVNGLYSGVNGAMFRLCNNAINDVMPTICFDCHQCEFEIDDTLSHIETLSASNKDNDSPRPSIKIKIGKLFTQQLYPLNADLTNDGNEYRINLSKSLMAGAYFNEDLLREKDVNVNRVTNITSDIDSIANTNAAIGFKQDESQMHVSSDNRISKTIHRMYTKPGQRTVAGVDAAKSNESDLSYRSAQSDSGLAALALTEGVMTAIHRNLALSEATSTDEKVEDNIRSNYAIDRDAGQNIPKEITSSTEPRPDYISEATLDDNSIEQTTNPQPQYRSGATLANNSIEQNTVEQPNYISEATQNDNTIEQTSIQPNYISEATLDDKTIEQSSIQPEYGSEATQDDNQIEQTSIQPEYGSEATRDYNTIDQTSWQPEYGSEATQDDNTIEQSAIQPPYGSEATQDDNQIEQTSIQPPYGSEATQDDNQIEQTSIQPPYGSEATQDGKSIEQTSLQPEYGSEATQDDNEIEQTSIQPEYISEATYEGNVIEQTSLQPDYLSGATLNENTIDQTSIQPEYRSEATEEENTIDTTSIQPPYISEATLNENTIDQTSTRPPYGSEATQEDNEIEQTSIQPLYVSEATEKTSALDNNMTQPPYRSEATEEENTIEHTSLQPEYVSEATLSENTIEQTSTRPPYISEATLDTNQIEKILEEYPEEFDNAVKYLEKIKDFSYENENLRATGSSEEYRKQVGEVIAREILENISKSEATSGKNPMSDLANIILNNAAERSEATRKTNTISAFSMLN